MSLTSVSSDDNVVVMLGSAVRPVFGPVPQSPTATASSEVSMARLRSFVCALVAAGGTAGALLVPVGAASAAQVSYVQDPAARCASCKR